MDMGAEVAVRKTTMKSLAEATADYYKVNYTDLLGDGRRPYITKPRHVFFFVAHKKVGHNLSEICRFSDKNHSTILYAVRKIKHRVPRTVSDEIVSKARELDARKRMKYLELAKEVGE